MTKETTIPSTILQVTYYCDNCEKELDTKYENDDGYIPESKYEVETSYYFHNKWYKFKKCLCPECRNEFITNVENTLKQLGFKVEL